MRAFMLAVAIVGAIADLQYHIPPRAQPAFPHLLSSTAPSIPAFTILVPLNHSSDTGEHISLRYWVDDSCFQLNGPLFVHLGGEGTQGPVGCTPQFHAISLSIEHRFYGKSWVHGKTLTETLAIEHLEHLTVSNALADAKAVIDAVKARYPTVSKVISFGGSYSGGLSAFLRMEFPETVLASVSESGVVSCALDFNGFDSAIALSARISASHPTDDQCADDLIAATAAMERMAAAGQSADLLRIFNASHLKDLNDFWYAVADGPAMLIQYGSKAELCDGLAQTAANSSDRATATNLAAIITAKYGLGFVGGCFYDTECFADPARAAIASPEPMERQWRFQKCNEMAFLQDAPETGAIRSANLTFDVLTAQCEKAFGVAFGSDKANEAIRERYGSYKPKGSNIFFLDYSDDPWRAATVDREWVSHTAVEKNLVSCYTVCNGCGHCGAGVPRDLTHCHDEMTSWLAKLL